MRKRSRNVVRYAAGLAAAIGVTSAQARAQDDDTAKLRAAATDERIKALEDKLSSPDLFRVYWKDGLRLTTPDNKFDLRLGGRIHFESEFNQADNDLERTKRYSGDSGDVSSGKTAFLGNGKDGQLEDGQEMRRARLYLAGTLYEHVEFKWQYDFAKGAVADKDVYGGLINLGDWIPNFRAGHQYEPFGLDALTSSNDSTFIERSAISNIIAPNRNPGFLFWKNVKDENGDARFHWAAGLFRDDAGDNAVSQNDGAWDLTARLDGTPYYVDQGKKMLHLGASATRRSVAGRGSGQSVTYAGKPEVDLFGNFVNTGAMKRADVDWRYGLESVFNWKNWSLQSEYMLTRTDMGPKATLDNPSFHGWYAQVSYMLSGESRRVKTIDAHTVMQNPKPFANAFENGGQGAWELALRWSTIDLNDGNKATGGVRGGQLDMATLGLNWYLNPATRVMWDLSRINLDQIDPALGKGGDALVAQMRLQIAF